MIVFLGHATGHTKSLDLESYVLKRGIVDQKSYPLHKKTTFKLSLLK